MKNYSSIQSSDRRAETLNASHQILFNFSSCVPHSLSSLRDAYHVVGIKLKSFLLPPIEFTEKIDEIEASIEEPFLRMS